jgi:NADH:ubiquinone oxidoreductase subunit 4 (subunit M)
MVIHAPPFNILCLPLVLLRFIPSVELKIKIMKWFSLGVFWLENIIGVTFFIAFELCLLPIVYCVCLFNIGCNTRGLFTTVFNLFLWSSIGLLILLCILCMDTFVLLKILAMHNGCKENEVIEQLKSNALIGEASEVLKSKEEQTED